MPNHGEYTIYLVKRAQIFEEFAGLLDRWNENCTLNTERKKNFIHLIWKSWFKYSDKENADFISKINFVYVYLM